MTANNQQLQVLNEIASLITMSTTYMNEACEAFEESDKRDEAEHTWEMQQGQAFLVDLTHLLSAYFRRALGEARAIYRKRFDEAQRELIRDTCPTLHAFIVPPRS